MPIETIHRYVELTVGKPAVIRGIGVIQHARKQLMPQQGIARLLRPVAKWIGLGLPTQAIKLGWLQARLRHEIRRWLENTLLVQDRFDVPAHTPPCFPVAIPI